MLCHNLALVFLRGHHGRFSKHTFDEHRYNSHRIVPVGDNCRNLQRRSDTFIHKYKKSRTLAYSMHSDYGGNILDGDSSGEGDVRVPLGLTIRHILALRCGVSQK